MEGWTDGGMEDGWVVTRSLHASHARYTQPRDAGPLGFGFGSRLGFELGLR